MITDHHSMGANSQKLPATNDNDNDSKVDRTIGHKRKRKFNEYQESSSSQYPTVSVPNIPQLSSNKKTM